MATIDTLVEDIYKVLKDGIDEIPSDIISHVGTDLGERLKPRGSSTVFRMSSIGDPCLRKLWYKNKYPDQVEEINPETKFKFLYGDLIEETLLLLAELAGHSVTGRQTEMEIAGIKGHRDAVIDGVVVDVKSASTYSFRKFKDGLTKQTDAFGYITQLQSYLHASQTDELVTDKTRGAFLVADKTLGHIHLDIHPYVKKDWESEYKERSATISGDTVPGRSFQPEPDGKSGNLKLPVNCAYCPVKRKCHPQLRCFIYSSGPVYLTKVLREPKVPEAK